MHHCPKCDLEWYHLLVNKKMDPGCIDWGDENELCPTCGNESALFGFEYNDDFLQFVKEVRDQNSTK